MRTVLILLILIVTIGGAVGFYQGWFTLSSDNDNGKPNVTLSVDKDKMEVDKDKVMESVQGAGDSVVD